MRAEPGPGAGSEPGPGTGRGLGHVERQLRAYLREPFAPAVPQRAATVVLLREGTGAGRDTEAFLLERAATMAFAPGQTVFPGGSVDEADQQVPAERIDAAGLDAWARGFACDHGQARALLAAAVREVFEETGVLLALDASRGRPVAGGPALAGHRGELLAGRRTFADVLAALGAVLTPALLTPCARWLTPVWSARRYDTHFFVAALPPGQTASDGSGEAASVAWRTPADALARVRDGATEMFTPTFETLAELAELARTPGDLARTSAVAEIMTRQHDLRTTTFALETSPGRAEVFVERPSGRTRLLSLTL
jgi:8-oxo-dGTP pyrophosphatase MutT (NUDIX family)